MELSEFREYVGSKDVIEVHENTWSVRTHHVIINGIITLKNVYNIHVVGDVGDEEVWFNDCHISLSDISELFIGTVRSYL